MKPLWLAVGLTLALSAHADQASHVHASGAWIRLLPAGLPAGGYVILKNDAAQPAVMTAASTARYENAMLHRSSSEAGMARMAAVERITIPAHGRATLAPGGYHLMLMHATSPVNVGEPVPITLTFADGSTLKVPFAARPANATDAVPSDKPATPAGH